MRESRLRKWVIRIFFTLGTLLACLLVPVLLHLRRHRDPPPPDVSDLLVKPQPIPEDENAYADFVAAGKTFQTFEDIHDLYHRIWLGEHSEEDLKSFRVHLEENQTALAHLRRGLKKGKLSVPLRKDIDKEYPELVAYHHMTGLLRIAVKYFDYTGDEAEKVNALLEWVRFGVVMSQADAEVLEFLHGNMNMSMSLWIIREQVRHQTPAKDALSALQTALPKDAALRECTRDVILSQFRRFHGLVQKMGERALRIEEMSFREDDGPGYLKRWDFLMNNSFTNQPNRTLSEASFDVRYWLDRLDTYDGPPHPTPEYKSTVINKDTFLEPNQFGKVVWNWSEYSNSGIIRIHYRARMNLAATRLLLALRRYELDKGEIPERLDFLVPRYLEEIPLDPYDGKPFRYLPERRLIYSVGADLVDGKAWLSPKSENDSRNKQGDAVYFLDQSWDDYLKDHFPDTETEEN